MAEGPGRFAVVFLGVAIVAIGLILGLVRASPFDDDIRNALPGDDWHKYRRFAVSIVDEGLLIPAAPGVYWQPGGFLYNYFVAFIFALFGQNSAYVYVAHHVCLALSCVLLFLLARRALAPPVALAFLLFCVVAYVPIFRYWSMRLLSENVAVAVYPALLLLFVQASGKRALGKLAAAGGLMGALALLRPNLAALAPLLAILLLAEHLPLRQRAARLIAFLGPAAAVLSLLPIRNFIVAGQFFATGRYVRLFSEKRDSGWSWEVAAGRALTSVGIHVTDDGIAFHGSFLLVTLASVVALVIIVKMRRFHRIDAVAVATIVAAYGTFIVMPKLGGYGMRFHLPYMPMLFLLVFHAVSLIYERYSGGRASWQRPPGLRTPSGSVSAE